MEFRSVPAGTAYYLADDGQRWRIFDCELRDGLLEHVYLEAESATHRVFSASPTKRLLYRRKPDEVFNLSPETCERQLGGARPLKADPPFHALEDGPEPPRPVRD